MLHTKIVSSMEKCFPDESIRKFRPLKRISAFRNERLSVQLLTKWDEAGQALNRLTPIITGKLAPYAKLRTVSCVPVLFPVFTNGTDDNYLRTTPGLYPDVLSPMISGGIYNPGEKVIASEQHLQSTWITFDLDGQIPAGSYRVGISLKGHDGTLLSHDVFTVEIIDALLPPQETIVTQWFHCDALAEYYRVKVWSEAHWKIIEAFLRTAVENGINMILTPIHTPPLDTDIGGERLTVQLVDVEVRDGKYSFGFDRLDRWIDLCDKVGVKYFEIAHLFTQWGALHAPKIMATVDGKVKRIFGWETDATGKEYSDYLRTFLPAFLDHMKARGDDRRCYFHVSDEPNKEQLDAYRRAKAVVADILKGYPIMDALSDFDFFRQGVVDLPIPSNDHIKPFIDAKIKGLWTYYCCGQGVGVSNRFLSMPLWRTRAIGSQFFKYDIEGFLQWGYNFYRDHQSRNPINPFLETSGMLWVPAGDAYSVYPGADGAPLESIRLVSFHEALQDQRAMNFAASLLGKDRVVALIEEHLGEVRFDDCPRSAAPLLAAREAVNQAVKAALAK